MQLYLKKDLATGGFLRILRNFEDHLRTAAVGFYLKQEILLWLT